MGIFGKKPAVSEYLKTMHERPPQIDVDKEYDVYCRSYRDEFVVHRKVKFKGKRSLPGQGGFAIADSYHVIERKDGSQLYLTTFQILLFCEHGVDPGFEILKGTERQN